MRKKRRISIIVPVYNIKDYLRDCVNSIIKQMRDGIEIILVDDGSTDESSDICDELVNQYKEIRVVHKKNGGLSDARNAGIDNSNGEYIIFLDGDDMLVDGSIGLVMRIIDEDNPDLITCDFKNVGVTCAKVATTKRYVDLIDDYLEMLGDIPWAAWRSVYRASTIKDNGLKFKKGLVGAEDCEFFVRYFEKCKKKVYSNILLIDYRVNREGSITNKLKYEAIYGELETFETNYRKFDMENNSRVRSLFAKKYVNTITTLYHLDDKDEIKQLAGMIKKNKDIIKDAKGNKYLVARLVFKLFGYYRGSRLLKLIKGSV